MVAGQRDAQQRGLASGSPGPHRHGQEIEAGLIYPDDGPPLLGGFCSRAGQRSCYQAAIAASSRCLVTLRRSRTRPLHAVAQTMEEAVDMGGMVGDAERAANDLSDPLARPDLPAKAVRLRPTSHERRNLGALLLAQSRCRASSRMAPTLSVCLVRVGPRPSYRSRRKQHRSSSRALDAHAHVVGRVSDAWRVRRYPPDGRCPQGGACRPSSMARPAHGATRSWPTISLC
jgi:hypothetical protein